MIIELRRLGLLPILLLLAFCAQGQSSGLSVSFNPNYSYRMVSIEGDANINLDNESAIFGYCISLLYSRTTQIDGVRIETGISFSKTGWNYGDSFISDNSSSVSSTQQLFYFLNLPLWGYYQPTTKGAIAPVFKLGINNWFLLEEALYNSDQGKISLNSSEAKRYLPGFVMGFGLSTQLGKQTSFQALPNFNFTPFSLYGNSQANLDRYLFSIGVELKLTYMFQKEL